jgi:DUF1680 family protein
MLISRLICLSLAAAASAQPGGPGAHERLEPVPFTAVHFDDAFWSPRIETNRRVTVWYDFRMCEQTGRVRNFAIAGGLEQGEFEGIYFNDSDVFKVIEGAAYSLQTQPDPQLDAYLDGLIATIAAAQEDDGYLYTIRTIQGEHITQPAAGAERWAHLAHSHELYNVGHLYEAAVAHFQATGKRTLLDVATRNADLIDRVFGPNPGQSIDVPGHQEIELGLVRLAQVTGEQRYLDLAQFFLDMRGRADLRTTYGQYCQDHLPIAQQTEPVGHAVRAGYMYAAVADVAAIRSRNDWVTALESIWNHLVSRRMYLTGGIGAHRHNEGFGDDYDLPNDTAYNETCAAIASALWNHRMFLLTGDAKYMDIVERTIYNGFLAGISLSGDRFFYPNPLACDGVTHFNQGSIGRAPWFDCSCCPVNVVRFLPSLPGFAYASRDREVYVSLFVEGNATLTVAGVEATLDVSTNYPWEGDVTIDLSLDEPTSFAMKLRVPGWARGQSFPTDLYTDLTAAEASPRITVNGKPVITTIEHGYASVTRTWEDGDTISLSLPMTVRSMQSHDAVKPNAGRIAFERGPIVYCFEAMDNQNDLDTLFIKPNARASVQTHPDMLGGIATIDLEAERLSRDDQGVIDRRPASARAIPYYAWAHRETGAMAVWMPSNEAKVALPPAPPAPTHASQATVRVSHCWSGDRIAAINDQREPTSSADHSIPRHTWWSHRGTAEWAEMHFVQPVTLSTTAVYWFDDSGRGGCRAPASWRLSALVNGIWQPLQLQTAPGVALDQFNVVSFEPVLLEALRIDVQLQPDASGGILEWTVDE